MTQLPHGQTGIARLNQQTEKVEAMLLRERGEASQGSRKFHISIIMELIIRVKRVALTLTDSPHSVNNKKSKRRR